MYRIEADTHTHTLASQHAYSTVMELVHEAKKKGLKGIAVTDHGPDLGDAPYAGHFHNLKSIPRLVDGIVVLRGIEANLLDFDGRLDLDNRLLSTLDWVIVSIHGVCFTAGTKEDHTRAWMNVLQNPWVDVIGHSGQNDFEYDYESVIIEAGKRGKIIEINNHSFSGVRPGSEKNCPEIARLCKKHGVRIVVNSDTHFATQLGQLDTALKMLEEIDFPPELILNSSLEKLLEYINQKRQNKILLT